MKWTTQAGKEIEVEDMDDNHALNTVNMLMRNSTPQIILECILVGRKKLLDDIAKRKAKREFTLQGDIAQMHHDMHMEEEYYDGENIDTDWYKEGF
tara:strand:- start:224 stop:511 length:288 start_codon:yes stop_codon:yes gene_type:complete